MRYVAVICDMKIVLSRAFLVATCLFLFLSPHQYVTFVVCSLRPVLFKQPH